MGITRQQALDCFASDDLIGIGMEADAIRRSLHPEGVVSYTIERPIHPAQGDLDKIFGDVHHSVAMGATCILLPSDSRPEVPLERYEALLSGIKTRFPGIQLHGLSATQILALAAASELSLRDTLARLRDAGLDSIAGSSVILDDDVRTRAAPDKCSAADWINVHRSAHRLGLASKATMIFGVGETMEQRIDHLSQIRSLQQESDGFTAFTPIPCQPGVAVLPQEVSEPTAVEYLKTLAISRLYLDNIPNLQGSWPTQGIKVLQMGLRFGSNDVGSVLVEERINRPGGATEEELRRIIREAGFRPAQRDALYRTMYLN